MKLVRNAAVSAAAVEDVRRRALALDLGAPLAIRVNPRARRLLLRIDAAARTVELVLPRGVPAEHGLRFLAAQAKTYNIDTSRMVVTGESAGGHLALTTGILPESAGLDRERFHDLMVETGERVRLSRESE